MSKKSKIIIYVLLTIMALYFLSPFVYMLFTTFKTEAEAIAYPPRMEIPKLCGCLEFTAFWQIFSQFCSGYGRNDDRTGSVMLPCGVWICKI